jgi:hypothetical protein
MLINFIQILKSLVLFSVFYSQPKIEILWCDTSKIVVAHLDSLIIV